MKIAVFVGGVIILAMIAVIMFVPARTADEQPLHQENQFTNMRLTSPAFKNNEPIPVKYTCDGDPPAGGISPPLEISGVPTAAKSLVLIVDDPDAPAGTLQPGSGQAWVHWIIWNLDPATTEIKEGIQVPETHLGMTSFGKPGYGGPCPPSGTHRYVFKLYALDTSFPSPPEPFPTKEQLERAMRNHILDRAELIGLYKRQSS